MENQDGTTNGQKIVMLAILDRYILKRYLFTFLGMLLLFVPISIMVSLAEKIGKIIQNEVPLGEVILFYTNFTLVIGNLLLPIFLFLSIIFFTSKLASNTEIIAILSSGVSYGRFLRPYFIGATLVAFFIFMMSMFIVPHASIGFNEFEYKYFKRGKPDRTTQNIFNQLNDQDYLYLSSFDPNRNIGYNFTYEHFDSLQQLDYKISATNIRWIAKDSIYRLTNAVNRKLRDGVEIVQTQRRLDTLFTFKLEDLTPVSYAAETKNLFELNDFIADQKRKGAANINAYILVQYRRWALPFTAFILTVIAVAVSSVKRRGGMGLNLALGIVISLVYIFSDRIFGTLAEQSGFSPLLAVLLPNLVFGIFAMYLLMKAKR